MQNLKLLLATLIISVAFIAGAGWFFSHTTQQIADQGQYTIPEAELITADSATKGATASAQYTLVEFSDLQCPACRDANPEVKSLVAQFPDKIRLIYRHYPLLSIHPNSLAAAYASEAAAEQGKFWEFHDLLFERQDQWAKQRDPQDFFVTVAKELQLNEEQFRADQKKDSVRARVDRDLRLAEQYKLPGTPTFYLNGQKMDFADIRSLIQASQTSSPTPEI